MKRVMVFGTFDLLHEGHINFLKQAKQYGDYLIVVVARDVNVQRFKGIKPQQNELKRLESVKKVAIIDKAVSGSEENIYQVLDVYKPHIICLGYDQNAQRLEEELKKRKINISIHRLEPFAPEQHKSTLKRKGLQKK